MNKQEFIDSFVKYFRRIGGRNTDPECLAEVYYNDEAMREIDPEVLARIEAAIESEDDV